MTDAERRSFPRFPLDRPAKMYDQRGRRYLPCRACDVSRGGAMIELERSWPVRAGDRLLLGVPSSGAEAVLARAEMLEVEVMRTLTSTSGRQVMAVRFVHVSDVAINDERLAAAA